jgi:hypothetical protein
LVCQRANTSVRQRANTSVCIGLPKSKYFSLYWFAKEQTHKCQRANTLVYIGLPKGKHINAKEQIHSVVENEALVSSRREFAFSEPDHHRRELAFSGPVPRRLLALNKPFSTTDIGLPKSKHINTKEQTHCGLYWFAKEQTHKCQRANTFGFLGSIGN